MIRDTVDLDIVVSFHVVLVGLLTSPLMLIWSPQLRSAEERSIVQIWNFFLSIGAITGFVSNNRLFKTFLTCTTDKGIPLIGDVGMLSVTAPPDCDLPCRNFSQILRRPDDVQIIQADALPNSIFGTMNFYLGIPLHPQGVLLGLLMLCIGRQSPVEQCQHELEVIDRRRSRLPPRGRERRSLRQAERATYKAMANLICIVPMISVSLFVRIVFAEIAFNNNAIPKDEGNEQIGQWGGWFLAVVLIIVAILVAKLNKPEEHLAAEMG